MAVSPTDLTAPAGEVEPAWFPSDDTAALTARLQAYIDDGAARAQADGIIDVDEATTLWAYHRAYRAIWLRLSEAPSSLTMNDQGSRSRTDAQRDSFKAEADRLFTAYQSLIPASTPTTQQRFPSGAVSNKITW